MNEMLEIVEAIRENVPMYVGSRDLFGFINYLVCPVALLLANGAKRIDATVDEGFEISSDALLKVERNDAGQILPFQDSRYICFQAAVLNALSQELAVIVNTASLIEEWQFVQGILASHQSTESLDSQSGTTLRFRPDNAIFTVTDLSEAAFASYFRRLSYLHKGVHFTVSAGGIRQEFCAPNGIVDLFAAIASPYQLMHAPIHIVANEGGLDLELVIAYHSWKEDHLWCFMNHGRAVEGGTHEQGLLKALKRLKQKLDLPADFDNGVIAVASMRYPQATWQGCIKAKIGNPELKPLVCRVVVNEALLWLKTHPAVEAQIRQLETFRFPEAWFNRLG